MHNFGLIFSVDNVDKEAPNTSLPSDVEVQLWEKAKSLNIASLPLLNSTDILNTPRVVLEDPWRHSDVRGLIGERLDCEHFPRIPNSTFSFDRSICWVD